MFVHYNTCKNLMQTGRPGKLAIEMIEKELAPNFRLQDQATWIECKTVERHYKMILIHHRYQDSFFDLVLNPHTRIGTWP